MRRHWLSLVKADVTPDGPDANVTALVEGRTRAASSPRTEWCGTIQPDSPRPNAYAFQAQAGPFRLRGSPMNKNNTITPPTAAAPLPPPPDAILTTEQV